MPEAIIAYSIAVAPLSSAQKRASWRLAVAVNVSIFVMPCHPVHSSSVIRCATSGSSAGGIW